MTLLDIKEIDEIPLSIPANLASESYSIKKQSFENIVHEVVDRFVNIELFPSSSGVVEDRDEV